MKKYLLITLAAVLLCGCNSDLKTALGEVLSTVSPQSPGIIEATAGFIAGFAVFGL